MHQFYLLLLDKYIFILLLVLCVTAHIFCNVTTSDHLPGLQVSKMWKKWSVWIKFHICVRYGKGTWYITCKLQLPFHATAKITIFFNYDWFLCNLSGRFVFPTLHLLLSFMDSADCFGSVWWTRICLKSLSFWRWPTVLEVKLPWSASKILPLHLPQNQVPVAACGIFISSFNITLPTEVWGCYEGQKS